MGLVSDATHPFTRTHRDCNAASHRRSAGNASKDGHSVIRAPSDLLPDLCPAFCSGLWLDLELNTPDRTNKMSVHHREHKHKIF